MPPWEIFNLLNTVNFDLPNHIFGTPNFGRIFSAKPPREMQFGIGLASDAIVLRFPTERSLRPFESLRVVSSVEGRQAQGARA